MIDPISIAAVWLAKEGGGLAVQEVARHLSYELGVQEPPLTASKAERLLAKFLRELKGRLDEDRLALLDKSLSQLRDSSTSGMRAHLLANALDGFHTIAALPRLGETGGIPNSRLRCFAYLGMAVVHLVENDPPHLVADKIVGAVDADPRMASEYLGSEVVLSVHKGWPGPVGIWRRHAVPLAFSIETTWGLVGSVPFALGLGGKILAYADEHIIRVVDVESGTSTREFVNPDWREFLGVAISPDGMVIGGLSHSRTLLWHLQGGAQPDVLEVGTQGSLFAFSPDWRFLVIHRAAAQRPHLAVYSIGEKAELSRFPAPGYQELGSLAISPNYGIAAVDRRKQSEILLRDLYDNTVLRRFTLKGYHSFELVSFTPDGERVVAVGHSYDSETRSQIAQIVEWDTKSGEHVASSRQIHLGMNGSMTLTSDSRFVVAIEKPPSQDSIVVILRLDTLEVIRQLHSDSAAAYTPILTSPDGRAVAYLAEALTWQSKPERALVWRAD